MSLRVSVVISALLHLMVIALGVLLSQNPQYSEHSLFQIQLSTYPQPQRQKVKPITQQPATLGDSLAQTNAHPEHSTTGTMTWSLYQPAPPYPEIARKQGLEGKVLLEFQTNDQGYIQDLRLIKSSGHALLDQQALDSVKNWRLKPSLHAQLPIYFQLKSGHN